MEENQDREAIYTAYDPKGREVVLMRYKTRYRVEKLSVGYKSSFSGLETAEEIFQEQCNNSN